MLCMHFTTTKTKFLKTITSNINLCMTININSSNTKNHNYKNQHNITILNIMSQTLTLLPPSPAAN